MDFIYIVNKYLCFIDKQFCDCDYRIDPVVSLFVRSRHSVYAFFVYLKYNLALISVMKKVLLNLL